MLNEYLPVTYDEYTIVKLTGKSKSIPEEKEIIIMKMDKEQERTAKQAVEKKGKKNRGTAAYDLDEKLFESLCSLQAEIARKDGVPPYIVFSDKLFVHMCVICSENRQVMLSVGGFGEVRYEKYGE